MRFVHVYNTRLDSVKRAREQSVSYGNRNGGEKKWKNTRKEKEKKRYYILLKTIV